MDENSIYKMTGKTSKEVDKAIEKMERRTEKTKEHQRLTREIFDVQWPEAVKTGSKDDWERVCVAIDGVIDYLQKNADYFPNYDKHITQWGTLKKVADCVCCDHTTPCDNACINEIVKKRIAKVA